MPCSVYQRAMNRLHECPVCGVGVTLHFLHEHYAAHFQHARTGIKEVKTNVGSVVNASSTSTEVQQQQQQQQETNHVNSRNTVVQGSGR